MIRIEDLIKGDFVISKSGSLWEVLEEAEKGYSLTLGNPFVVVKLINPHTTYILCLYQHDISHYAVQETEIGAELHGQIGPFKR